MNGSSFSNLSFVIDSFDSLSQDFYKITLWQYTIIKERALLNDCQLSSNAYWHVVRIYEVRGRIRIWCS